MPEEGFVEEKGDWRPKGTKIKDFFELRLIDYQIDNLYIGRR